LLGFERFRSENVEGRGDEKVVDRGELVSSFGRSEVTVLVPSHVFCSSSLMT